MHTSVHVCVGTRPGRGVAIYHPTVQPLSALKPRRPHAGTPAI